jgi:hypothetical protein
MKEVWGGDGFGRFVNWKKHENIEKNGDVFGEFRIRLCQKVNRQVKCFQKITSVFFRALRMSSSQQFVAALNFRPAERSSSASQKSPDI